MVFNEILYILNLIITLFLKFAIITNNMQNMITGRINKFTLEIVLKPSLLEKVIANIKISTITMMGSLSK